MMRRYGQVTLVFGLHHRPHAFDGFVKQHVGQCGQLIGQFFNAQHAAKVLCQQLETDLTLQIAH